MNNRCLVACDEAEKTLASAVKNLHHSKAWASEVMQEEHILCRQVGSGWRLNMWRYLLKYWGGGENIRSLSGYGFTSRLRSSSG